MTLEEQAASVVSRLRPPQHKSCPKSLPLQPSCSLDGAEPQLTIPNLARLPRSVLPKRYELKLDIYPEQFRYSGQVNIRVYCYEDTSTVWLHSLRLEIFEAAIQFQSFQLPVRASKVSAGQHKEHRRFLWQMFEVIRTEGYCLLTKKHV